jgi:hypothetical protein
MNRADLPFPRSGNGTLWGPQIHAFHSLSMDGYSKVLSLAYACSACPHRRAHMPVGSVLDRYKCLYHLLNQVIAHRYQTCMHVTDGESPVHSLHICWNDSLINRHQDLVWLYQQLRPLLRQRSDACAPANANNLAQETSEHTNSEIPCDSWNDGPINRHHEHLHHLLIADHTCSVVMPLKHRPTESCTTRFQIPHTEAGTFIGTRIG